MESNPASPKSRGRPDLPMMDQVHGALFQRALDGIRYSSETLRVLSAYRSKLRAAEKFVVDDDAVRLVCNLSQQSERMAAGWPVLARLPYDAVWLEMSLHAKVLEYERLGRLRGGKAELDKIPPVAGYLFYRDREAGARWICHYFTKTQSDTSPNSLVIPGLVAFVFDPEGAPHDPVRGSRTWRAPTLSLLEGFPKVQAVVSLNRDDPRAERLESKVDPEFVLCGDLERHDADHHEISSDVDLSVSAGRDTIHARGWFTNRGGAIIDPFWDSHYRGDVGRLHEAVRNECLEQAGVMRYLVTLLATINGVPREVKTAQTLQGRRSVGANILPYFQHRTISLKLPRDDRVQWARRHLDRSSRNMPRPWHSVIGHWRIVEPGKVVGRRVGQAFCRHQPEMVEDGLAMCGRCEMLVRWIPSHYRGDPNVGIVEHTYKVRAA